VSSAAASLHKLHVIDVESPTPVWIFQPLCCN